jgi:mannose-1-phosphate guanylyltransferase
VLLAGGLGTRLRPAVADRPKVLAPVAGQPFLQHLLGWLEAQGIRRVVLALGHLAEQVEGFVEEHRAAWPGLTLVTLREPKPLGTGGALAACRPEIRSDPVLVMNSDTFVDVDLGAFVAHWAAAGAAAGLVAAQVEDGARYGRLELTADGRIARFTEKDPQASGPAWINAGIYLLRQHLVDGLPAPPSSLERDLLERLPAGSVLAFPTTGRFIDIGTPESLAAAPSVLTATLEQPRP